MPDLKLFKPKDKDNNEKKGKKINLQKGGKGSLFGKSRGKFPTKTTINLAIKEAESVSLRRLLPGLAVGLIIFLVLGKFLVYDKISAMIKASNEVHEIQSQLDATYANISSYQDIEDDYAHYTYSGMTEEELGRVDRVSVMALVDQIMQAGVKTSGWNLTGNVLTIPVTGSSLQTLNELSEKLENKSLVDRCVITTANKQERLDSNGEVNVSYVIYLQKPQEESDNTGAAPDNGNGQVTTDQQAVPNGSINNHRGKEAAS